MKLQEMVLMPNKTVEAFVRNNRLSKKNGKEIFINLSGIVNLFLLPFKENLKN